MRQIMKLPLNGGTLQPTGAAIDGISSFSLSPDGSRLAVSHSTGITSEVLVVEKLQSWLNAARR